MAATSSTVIYSSAELKIFLSSIRPDSAIYLDLDGKTLSRHGTLTLATILIQPQNVTRVVDVLSIGKSTFDIESDEGTSLRSILEDPGILKGVWDVRNDADALWSHFQVKLAGVVDIQLLENASRPPGIDRSRLSGLRKAIMSDSRLGFHKRQGWILTKDLVWSLMSQDIFSRRPLAPYTIQYCVNDVVHLPALQEYYEGRITLDWLVRARGESHRRVVDAWSPEYQPQSPDKVFAPWGRGSAMPKPCQAIEADAQETMLSTDEAFEAQWDLILDDQGEYYDEEEELDYWESRRNYANDFWDLDRALVSCWDRN